MPFLFIIIGLVMVTASVRDTVSDTKDTSGAVSQKGLVSLVQQDFTGKGNFIYWVLSILVIGALGYIEPLKPVSRAFMMLVVIVLFLSNQGVFQKFQNAIGETQDSSTSPIVGIKF